MSENRSPPGRSGDEPGDGDGSHDDLEFAEGRYLYCVVSAADDESFEATGVEDEPVSLVTEGGLGAVVHECADVYDSADPTTVRRWVLSHQSVVDDAGEVFDTPLPFQFDTILKGDDATVREWLAENRARLSRVLDSLAGHWEYRIEVVRTEPIAEERFLEADEDLATLRERIEDAEEGTAFLLEKQYDERLEELRRSWRQRRTDDLRNRLEDHAREVHALERTPSVSLEGDDGDGETICRLTVLAPEDEEGSIGSVLDDVAAAEGLEVRFTGPWPPYTFSPELGGESPGDSGES